MLTNDDVVKIRSLMQEIHGIYAEAKQRPSNMTCDICGCGDYSVNKAVYRVKRVSEGYEHRQDEAPVLCSRHSTGWSITHMRKWPRTDEEVDLLFAMFLARHLCKQAETHAATQGATQ